MLGCEISGMNTVGEAVWAVFPTLLVYKNVLTYFQQYFYRNLGLNCFIFPKLKEKPIFSRFREGRGLCRCAGGTNPSKPCCYWWHHELETFRFSMELQSWHSYIKPLFRNGAMSFQKRKDSFPKSHVFLVCGKVNLSQISAFNLRKLLWL